MNVEDLRERNYERVGVAVRELEVCTWIIDARSDDFVGRRPNSHFARSL